MWRGHVAVIVGCIGRWACTRPLPREAGDFAGRNAVRESGRAHCEMKLGNLTLFAFSSENWKRPKAEVGALMGLFRTYFRSDMDELVERNVRMRIIGHRGRGAGDLHQMLLDSESRPPQNPGTNLPLPLQCARQADIEPPPR